jgi:hypothetical protein
MEETRRKQDEDEDETWLSYAKASRVGVIFIPLAACSFVLSRADYSTGVQRIDPRL